MKWPLISLLLLSATNTTVNAQQDQQHCGATAPTVAWENAFQTLLTGFKAEQQDAKDRSAPYTIPVIFHIVHGGEPVGTFPNVDAEQAYAQIEVLNQDYNANGKNSQNYPANAFVHWVVNQGISSANIDSLGRVKIACLGVEFCPAITGPDGNLLPEPGIDRINFFDKGWPNPNSFPSKDSMRIFMLSTLFPQSIWDAEKYLNVWVTDRNADLPYSGFGTPPALSGLPDLAGQGAGPMADGVWCWTKALGSKDIYPSGIYATPGVSGRVLTHETGHWLGLRHIWGDAVCGNDFCDDTPPADTFNIGNPSYPLDSGSCSAPSNAPDGEMFMNFMDYTVGQFEYMFTTDQVTRMQTALVNCPRRKELGTHGLCGSASGMVEKVQNTPLKIFPNPANEMVELNLSGREIQRIQLYNQLGDLLMEPGSGRFSVAQLPCGFYLILVETDKGIFSARMIKT